MGCLSVRMDPPKTLRWATALVLAAGVHALLLIWLLASREQDAGRPLMQRVSTILVFITPPIVQSVPEPKPREETEKKRTQRSPPPAPRDTAPSIAPPEPASPAATEAHVPKIDWKAQAESSAAAIAENAPVAVEKECGPQSAKDPRTPCRKPAEKIEWKPRRLDFENGLPYVRIGPKCLVGLGFLGCKLGDKPVDGSLLEPIDDAERDRTSVPEAK